MICFTNICRKYIYLNGSAHFGVGIWHLLLSTGFTDGYSRSTLSGLGKQSIEQTLPTISFATLKGLNVINRGRNPRKPRATANNPNPLLLLLLLSLLAFSCQTKKHLSKEPAQAISIDTLKSINVTATTKYQGFETQYFNLLHTKLSVTPVWNLRHLNGIAILTLTPHVYPQDTLTLDAKDFNIYSVELVNRNGDSLASLNYKYNRKTLSITPYQKTQWLPGDTFNVKIVYTAKPEDLIKDSIIPNHDEQGLYFVNPDGTDSAVPRELWSQGETEHNSCWFPTIDAPDQKMTQEISITVDTGLTTLSNGTLEYTEQNGNGTKTDHWALDKPHSVYLAMIAVGTYSEIKDKWRDSIPVNYYVEPEYAPYAKLVFGHTPAMIEFYSKLLNYDFPWPKYSQIVVRDFTSGAMENTTAVTMYEPLQHDDRANLDETDEEIISHELFHHWFGDLVTCKSWANLALNESFAQFAEKLWTSHEYGKEEADIEFKTDLDAYLAEAAYKKGPIIEHYYSDPEDLFDKTRYEKGALVLNMLKHYLGDEVFFKALHNYLVTNAYKCVEISDLQKAMEEASGKDLNWFFDQWFNKPGHPVLEIRQQYDATNKKLYVFVNQTQLDEKTPAFKIPTELDVYNHDGHVDKHKIWLKHASDSFSFKMDAPPLLVNFDAEKILLCHKSDVKPTGQWYYQYFHTPELLDRYEALKALSKTPESLSKDSIITLWASGLKDHSWYIRKTAIGLIATQGKMVIDTLIPRMEQLALTDKNSIVRSSALAFIQDKEGVMSNNISLKALHDSSYYVTSIAIHNVFLNTPNADSAILVSEMAEFDHYRSLDVLASVADIYARYADAGKALFFKNMAARMQAGYVNLYLLDYLKFLIRMNTAVIQQNEKFILSIGHLAKTDWELSSCQYFLNALAANLSARSENEAKKIADDFSDKAKQLKK